MRSLVSFFRVVLVFITLLATNQVVAGPIKSNDIFKKRVELYEKQSSIRKKAETDNVVYQNLLLVLLEQLSNLERNNVLLHGAATIKAKSSETPCFKKHIDYPTRCSESCGQVCDGVMEDWTTKMQSDSLAGQAQNETQGQAHKDALEDSEPTFYKTLFSIPTDKVLPALKKWRDNNIIRTKPYIAAMTEYIFLNNTPDGIKNEEVKRDENIKAIYAQYNLKMVNDDKLNKQKAIDECEKKIALEIKKFKEFSDRYSAVRNAAVNIFFSTGRLEDVLELIDYTSKNNLGHLGGRRIRGAIKALLLKLYNQKRPGTDISKLAYSLCRKNRNGDVVWGDMLSIAHCEFKSPCFLNDVLSSYVSCNSLSFQEQEEKLNSKRLNALKDKQKALDDISYIEAYMSDKPSVNLEQDRNIVLNLIEKLKQEQIDSKAFAGSKKARAKRGRPLKKELLKLYNERGSSNQESFFARLVCAKNIEGEIWELLKDELSHSDYNGLLLTQIVKSFMKHDNNVWHELKAQVEIQCTAIEEGVEKALKDLEYIHNVKKAKGIVAEKYRDDQRVEVIKHDIKELIKRKEKSLETKTCMLEKDKLRALQNIEFMKNHKTHKQVELNSNDLDTITDLVRQLEARPRTNNSELKNVKTRTAATTIGKLYCLFEKKVNAKEKSKSKEDFTLLKNFLNLIGEPDREGKIWIQADSILNDLESQSQQQEEIIRLRVLISEQCVNQNFCLLSSKLINELCMNKLLRTSEQAHQTLESRLVNNYESKLESISELLYRIVDFLTEKRRGKEIKKKHDALFHTLIDATGKKDLVEKIFFLVNERIPDEEIYELAARLIKSLYETLEKKVTPSKLIELICASGEDSNFFRLIRKELCHSFYDYHSRGLILRSVLNPKSCGSYDEQIKKVHERYKHDKEELEIEKAKVHEEIKELNKKSDHIYETLVLEPDVEEIINLVKACQLELVHLNNFGVGWRRHNRFSEILELMLPNLGKTAIWKNLRFLLPFANNGAKLKGLLFKILKNPNTKGLTHMQLLTTREAYRLGLDKRHRVHLNVVPEVLSILDFQITERENSNTYRFDDTLFLVDKTPTINAVKYLDGSTLSAVDACESLIRSMQGENTCNPVRSLRKIDEESLMDVDKELVVYFLIDVTSSMQPAIEAVIETLGKIYNKNQAYEIGVYRDGMSKKFSFSIVCYDDLYPELMLPKSECGEDGSISMVQLQKIHDSSKNTADASKMIDAYLEQLNKNNVELSEPEKKKRLRVHKDKRLCSTWFLSPRKNYAEICEFTKQMSTVHTQEVLNDTAEDLAGGLEVVLGFLRAFEEGVEGQTPHAPIKRAMNRHFSSGLYDPKTLFNDKTLNVGINKLIKESENYKADMSKNKLLIHISDAPGHGYGGAKCFDNSPEGDLFERYPEEYLRAITQFGCSYLFVTLANDRAKCDALFNLALTSFEKDKEEGLVRPDQFVQMRIKTMMSTDISDELLKVIQSAQLRVIPDGDQSGSLAQTPVNIVAGTNTANKPPEQAPFESDANGNSDSRVVTNIADAISYKKRYKKIVIFTDNPNCIVEFSDPMEKYVNEVEKSAKLYIVPLTKLNQEQRNIPKAMETVIAVVGCHERVGESLQLVSSMLEVIENKEDEEKYEKVQNSCPICFYRLTEAGSVIETSCSHYFHEDCIRQYFKYNKSISLDCSCPMCRRNLKQDQADLDKYYKNQVADPTPVEAQQLTAHQRARNEKHKKGKRLNRINSLDLERLKKASEENQKKRRFVEEESQCNESFQPQCLMDVGGDDQARAPVIKKPAMEEFCESNKTRLSVHKVTNKNNDELESDEESSENSGDEYELF